MVNELLTLWSSNAALSALIWCMLLSVVMYLGRRQAHQVFASSGRALYRSLRLAAFAIGSAEQRIHTRNREILLHQGAIDTERAIDREFSRVHDIVERDLGQYPALHRKLCDAIDTIENDYQHATESAPLPPAWGELLDTIQALPPSGDPAVSKILQNVKSAVEDSHSKTMKAFKQSSAERHRLLAGIRPTWRKIHERLDDVDRKVNGIDERAKAIDEQMQRYTAIREHDDVIAASLGASAFTQFFISGLVLVVAGLGGLINFQLIAMPMSEMVGGGSYIGGMQTSDIAALVIILIEIAMGLFLVESLRITHLFPVIHAMDDRMRRKMVVISFSILAMLASIEASLAYMRDLLALDREALNQALAGVGEEGASVQAHFRWIPSIGQMIMGLILPFALAFIAIPLESFIHSLRVVLSSLVVLNLRCIRVVLRTVASLLKHLMMLARHIYDMFIVIPLGIERLMLRARHTSKLDAEAGDWHTLDDEANMNVVAHEKHPVEADEDKKPAPKRKPSRRSRKSPQPDPVNLTETLA